jgi:hypothetical protein
MEEASEGNVCWITGESEWESDIVGYW